MQQTIDRQIINQILRYVQTDAEHERCGLVSVSPENQYQLHPVKNIADDSAREFEMDPQQLIQAMKQIRESQSELFAIFHSHPHADAQPSKQDIDNIGYPDALYMIVSLNTRGVLELRAYKLLENTVTTIDLQF